MPLPPEFIARLRKIVLMMFANDEGTRVAATNALRAATEAANLTMHDIAEHIDNPRIVTTVLSDRQISEIKAEIDAAYRRGRAEGGVASERAGVDFHATDGSDDWRRVALYVERERHRLPPRNQDGRTFEFIDNMAMLARSRYTRDLSPARGKWLYDLFHKLGGKVA